ncbi:lipocalin-like domain-containing protein [Streptococcus hyointestinalis]|uniref:lipocalin-like domain-containing protein n=1 Tax=Streptococcus hyointestinalis TaxID=1337 RepID=UPI0035110DAB
MSAVRLMNQAADYEKLGVNPDHIEVWEDSKRVSSQADFWEWWYFDAILEDGTAVVIQFLEKSFASIGKDNPKKGITFKITLPDRTVYEEKLHIAAKDCYYGGDKCDVHYDKNFFVGDLKNYHIHVEQIGKIAADLHLESLATPYRPGTAYFEFGDDQYYTWLCAVPKGRISGTLTIDGKTIEVTGYGYHDHQWGKSPYIKHWNHWTWARQSFDDYTLLVFDMTTTKDLGAKRFPLAFVEDKNGKIIFENEDLINYQVLETQVDPASGKVYPKKTRYTFSGQGKEVTYTLEAKSTIESFGPKTMTFPQKLAMRALHLSNMSYSRFLGKGEMIIKDKGTEIKREGELIYEFMNPGKPSLELKSK